MFDLRVQVPKILLHFYRCYEGVVKKERELKKDIISIFFKEVAAVGPHLHKTGK